MMKRHSRVLCGLLGLLWLAAQARSTDEQSAPLEESKRELETLKKQEALKKSGSMPTGDKPQLSVPQLTTGPSNTPAPTTPLVEAEKGGASTNWLLDGVAALDKERKKSVTSSGGTNPTDGGTTANEPIDFSDPAYLLKTYDAQRAQTGVSGQSAATDRTNVQASVNPLGDYLNSWLLPADRGGVKGILGDSMASSASADRMKRDGSASSTDAPLSRPGRDSPGAELQNPILSREDSSSKSSDAFSSPTISPTMPFVHGTGIPPGATSTYAAPKSAEAAAPEVWPMKGDRRYTPPSLIKDDKKYFPQLKRF